MPRPLSRGWSVVALLLFALAVGAGVLQNGSLPHVHAGGSPGFFNHDHDLTLLATLGGGALVPESVALVAALPLVAAAAVPELRHPTASPLRYSASRAPPSAS